MATKNTTGLETVKCRSCGADIFFVKMRDSGKMMPCNLPGQPAISIGPDEKTGATVGHITGIFIPHWATCPQADIWKNKKGGGQLRSAPFGKIKTVETKAETSTGETEKE